MGSREVVALGPQTPRLIQCNAAGQAVNESGPSALIVFVLMAVDMTYAKVIIGPPNGPDPEIPFPPIRIEQPS